MKKILFSVLMSSLLLGSTSVYAEATTADTSVVGGTLSVIPQDVRFKTFTINKGQQQLNDSQLTVTKVDDATGSGAGWSLSVSVSQFESGYIEDKTNSVAGSKMKVKLPPNIVKLGIWGLTQEPGVSQLVDSIHGPLEMTNEVTLSASPTRIAHADPGFGMGLYNINTNFSLQAPNYTYVSELSNAGTSSYSNSQELGLIATTYTAQFVYTLTSGI